MDNSRFNILGVCSGVGMLEIAIRIAIARARVIACVEWESYAAAVQLARMDDASMEPAPIFCGDRTVRRGFGADSLFAPGPRSDLWPTIIADSPHLAPAVEPGFRVLVDGLAYVVDQSRADQLRCTGNGVVALQAAVAFAILFERVKARLAVAAG